MELESIQSDINEEDGDNNTIRLNGTDSDSSDAGAKLLHDIEAFDGNIELNGTDSDNTNIGDNLIGESGIDFFADADAGGIFLDIYYYYAYTTCLRL